MTWSENVYRLTTPIAWQCWQKSKLKAGVDDRCASCFNVRFFTTTVYDSTVIFIYFYFFARTKIIKFNVFKFNT